MEFIGSCYSRGEGEAAKKVLFEMGFPEVEVGKPSLGALLSGLINKVL